MFDYFAVFSCKKNLGFQDCFRDRGDSNMHHNGQVMRSINYPRVFVFLIRSVFSFFTRFPKEFIFYSFAINH